MPILPIHRNAMGPIVAIAVLLCGAPGCGWYRDTDRDVVAVVDGEKITRGRLDSILYGMHEPRTRDRLIASRQDYLDVIDQYIELAITIPLGKKLHEEGKIDIPRELAREEYFRSIKNEEEQKAVRAIWTLPALEKGKESELVMGHELTADSIRFQKNVIEQSTDIALDKMLGHEAVAFLAMEAYKSGDLKLDEAVVRQEYEVTKSFTAPPLAYAAMMERLREEHGVEIYEDQLPTPSGGKSIML